MDPDQPPPPVRKVKFQPKKPPPRKSKATVQPKREEAGDAIEAQQLLQHLSDRDTLRRQPRAENKTAVQPTFIHGPTQSNTSRVSNVPQDGSHRVSSGSLFKGDIVMKEDSSPETEYNEPWDYAHTYYPTVVPWRKPYSGDPDILNEPEFGEDATKVEYDERTINPASDLGFMDSDEGNTRLLFFQLPQSWPVIKRSATAKGKEKLGTSAVPDQRGSVASAMGGRGSSSRGGTSERCCSLEELPAGLMGKLLVCKSGAVKIKLGDTLFDVSPGVDSISAQEVVAISTNAKECTSVGELHKQVVVTPDIEYLLNRDL